MTGDEPGAARHLGRAAEAFRSLDMNAYAAAVDLERGHLIGGDLGRALERSAEAWMREECVKSPERSAATLVPGIRRG